MTLNVNYVRHNITMSNYIPDTAHHTPGTRANLILKEPN